MTQKQKTSQSNACDFFGRFPTEDYAREYLINAHWPNGIVCPHCGHDEIYIIRQSKLLCCKHKSCSRQFAVRIGTIMEASAIPLRKWLFAMFLFGVHSKGVASTKRVEFFVGVTQKTAWFMCHRLCEAFADDGIVLDGVIEVDEVCIGGKERNKHNGVYHSWSKKHLHCYVNEIAKWRNMNNLPAFDDSLGLGTTIVRFITSKLTGRRLMCTGS